MAGKYTKSDILSLVEECLLQPRSIIKWWPALCHSCPSEETNKTILFSSFVERGFGFPTSDFFRGLLFHWGIQAHHLTPNSILHISIFVHLCEAFLGIEPHFDLFKHLFHLKPQPSGEEIYVVGGAGLQLRQGIEKVYIPYKLSSKVIDWKSNGFMSRTMLLHCRAGLLELPNGVAIGFKSLRACFK